MRMLKKKECKLKQKHLAKVLIKLKREKAENERDEKLCIMKKVLSKNGEILTEEPHGLQRRAEFYKEHV